MCKRIPVNGLWVTAGAALLLAVAPVRAGHPGYVGVSFGYRGYPGPLWVDPSPSYFGYHLDEYAAGYYGGGRYREYYGYGRGYGLADYPGPLAGPGAPPDYRGLWRLYPPVEAHSIPVVEPLAPAAPAKTTVSLRVQVPADAEVWLDGAKTSRTGTDRRFESPPVHSGTPYTYEIKARWTENGKAVEQSQIVLVRAGDQVTVNFPAFPEAQPPPARLPVAVGK